MKTIRESGSSITKKMTKANITSAFRGFFEIVKKDRALLIMLLPFFFYYIVLKYIPMYGVTIAFKDFSFGKGILGSEWVGLKYFIKFFNGYDAWKLIRNTLLISFYSLIFSFPAPIIFAILLNELKSDKFKKITQTISYLPHFISTVIVCGMVYNFLQVDGIINILLSRGLGIKPIPFLLLSEWFRTIFIAMGTWKGFGWGAIIYLTALTGIDPQLYEAAYMDGANRFQRIIHVTIPGIVPVIVIMLILRLGDILEVSSESILLLYNSATYETADVISTYVYRRGLLERNYSFGAAVGFFQSFVGLIMVLLSNKLARRYTGSGLW